MDITTARLIVMTGIHLDLVREPIDTEDDRVVDQLATEIITQARMADFVTPEVKLFSWFEDEIESVTFKTKETPQ